MQATRLFVFMLLLSSSTICAQSGRSVTVKAGEDAGQAWSPSGFYRFPQFSKAVLYRKAGGSQANALFNYNLLSATLQYINETGDTLDLINPSLFDSIIIDKRVFYYDDGFLESVAEAYPLRLVKKTQIKMRPETIGAYGGSTSTSAVDKISSYSLNGNMYSFSLSENMTFKESVSLFFMEANGNHRKATKTNLMLLLTEEKLEKAKTYLEENKVNFEKETDIKKLLDSL